MEADPDLGNEDGCEEFISAKLDQLVETSWDSFEEVSKQLKENSHGELEVVVACEENFANPEGDVKLSQEEFLQVFGFVLQIFGFAAELHVMGGLARFDISLQGKLESLEMGVAKDGELCSEKTRSVEENSASSSMVDQDYLKAKEYYSLVVYYRRLMLNMELWLVSVEMDVILLNQSYEFYLTRVNAMMLAEASPDELNVEMCEEPYNSSVVRVVLATLGDFQCREITGTFYLEQENTNLLNKKSGTTDFKNGLAMIGVGGDEPYTGSVASDVLANIVDIQHKGFTVYLYQQQKYIVLHNDIWSEKSEVDFGSRPATIGEPAGEMFARVDDEGGDDLTQVMEELLMIIKRLSLSPTMVE